MTAVGQLHLLQSLLVVVVLYVFVVFIPPTSVPPDYTRPPTFQAVRTPYFTNTRICLDECESQHYGDSEISGWRESVLSTKCLRDSVVLSNASSCERALGCGDGAVCHMHNNATECRCNDIFKGDGCRCDDPAPVCSSTSDDLVASCDFRIAYTGPRDACPPHSYLFESLPLYECGVWHMQVNDNTLNQSSLMPRCVCDKGYYGWPDDGIECIDEIELKKLKCVPPELVLSRRAQDAFKRGIELMLSVDYDKKWSEFQRGLSSVSDEIIMTQSWMQRRCRIAGDLFVPELVPLHSMGRCALVSSSGLLIDGHLGPEIDLFDKVFRTNRQTLSPSTSHDVGTKFDYRIVRMGKMFAREPGRNYTVLSVGNEITSDQSCANIRKFLSTHDMWPVKNKFVTMSSRLLHHGIQSSGFIALTTTLTLCNSTTAYCFNAMDFDSIAMFTPWYLPHHYDCNRGVANVFNTYYVTRALEQNDYSSGIHPFWLELGWLLYWEKNNIVTRRCPHTPYDLPKLCIPQRNI